MNRLFLALNGALALALVVLMWFQAAALAELRARHQGDRSTLGLQQFQVKTVTRHDRLRVLLDFGADMVPAARVGEPAPARLITLEPAMPVQCTWDGPRRLEILPRNALKPATRYTVRITDDLRSLDGRRVPEAAALTFETRRLKLDGAVVLDTRPRQQRFRIGFNLPVDRADLEKALSVRDPQDRPVPCRVTAAGAAVAAGAASPLDLFLVMPDTGSRKKRDGTSFEVQLDPGADAPALLEWVHVHLDASLRPIKGELPLGQMVPRRVRFLRELYVRRLESTRRGLRLSFNHDVDLPEEGTVILEPAVPFQVESTWNGLRLIGDFTPGESLTVQLKKGFPGHGSHRLTRDYQGQVRIRDRDPRLAFTQKGDVLSSRAIPELRLRGVNVRGFKVTARSVYPNNVVRLAQRPRWDDDMPETVFGPVRTRNVLVEAGRNERFEQAVSLEALLGSNARGYHLIQVQDLDRHTSRIRRLVQVTDLGVTVRAAPDAVAVRVQGLARGHAVAGARVRVLTPTNQPLVEGVTDARGVAVLRFRKSAEDRVPYLVAVEHEGDATFVDLDGFAVELADDALGGRPYLSRNGQEAFVAFDRGVVRPGGEIRATVVVRNQAGVAPGPAELVARWFAPDRKLRRTSRFTTSGAGLGLVRLTTDPSAATGAWRLEVAEARGGRVLGEEHVKVEAFVPDRLEAEAKLLAPLRLGGQARMELTARWLEGGPAARRPVRVHVRYDHHDFEAEAFPGYAFRGRRDQDAPPGGRPTLRTTLDERGRALVRFDLPDPGVSSRTRGAGRIGQALEAHIVAEVEDPSGRPVRVGLDELVLRPGFLIGVKADRDEAHLIAVTPEGGLFPTPSPIPVEVDLVRRTWSWSRVSRDDGGYRYEFTVRSRTLQHHTTRIRDGRGHVRFRPVAPGGWGWLAVVVRYGDVRVEQTVGEEPLKPDRLRVQGPDRPVAPGQEAELVVASPFAGTAFVTLEGSTVHATKVVSLPGGEARVRVRLPETLALPNVHAVVTLTAAQDRADPEAPVGPVVPDPVAALPAPPAPALRPAPESRGPVWIVGGTSIPVAHPERRADVQLDAPGQVLPGSQVTVHVDAPGATQAVVALVDEGILRITGHPDPDPDAWFQAARRLDSRGADTGTSLLTGVRFRPAPEPGGDGDERLLGPRLDATTTSTIQTVALLEGPVDLDEQGRAAVRFTLPPYEGRLRAMVIAAGPEVTGGAAAPVRVAAPLGLRVAMPRMVSPGDICTIPVTVRNGTGSPGVVALTCMARGGLEVEDGLVVVGDNIAARPRTMALSVDEVRTLSVRIKAGRTPGVQGLDVLARLAGETRRVSGTMQVRPVARFTVERIGLVIQGDCRQVVPGRWVGGKVRARLILDRGPGEQLRPTLESLLHYPYGCVEQTTSQCFALLAAGSLLKTLPVGHRTTDVGAGLHAGVGRLMGMQTGTGGLAMWPGGEHTYPFGSVYALDFLLAARAAGVNVPERPLADLVEWVYRELARDESVSLRAYAAEVLSRAGKPVAPWLRLLATRTSRVEDRARLALGLARLGHDEEAAGLLQADGLFRQARREGGGLLRSPFRERAVELRARMAATPHDARIPRLVKELSHAVRKPYAWSTQEQGQMLLALARYYDAHAASSDATRATVRIGTASRIVKPGRPETFTLDQGAEIQLASDGVLYGLLEFSGHRLDVRTVKMEDLKLKRTITDVDTGRPARAFRRGGLYEVVLEGETGRPLDNLLVTDVVPGGFEIENPRLGAATSSRFRKRQPDHLEIRDDRVLFFAARRVKRNFTYAYRMRAVFPGDYQRQPFSAEALYEPGVETQGGGSGRVKISGAGSGF